MARPNFKEVDIAHIQKDDVIIAVMGPTGAGKSTLIDLATGQGGRTIGHQLKSFTADVRAVSVPHPTEPGRRVVWVDTPGFDDTKLSQADILKTVANWLKKTYSKDIKLSGILYLHRVSDNRMSGSKLQNLRIFGKLCGDGPSLRKVILVTTMHDPLANAAKKQTEKQREEELKTKYWSILLEKGATMTKFDNTRASAWRVIEPLLRYDQPADRQAYLLQEEMVELKRRLSETAAGAALFESLNELLRQQQEALRKLQEAKNHSNPQIAQAVNNDYEVVQERLKATLDQVREMKIPFGRKLMSLFTFRRRAHSKAIDIPLVAV